MKLKLCAWKCGRKTNRRCGICLECCNARDEMNKRIDAGLEAYVPPDKRPGHRFYKGDIGKRANSAEQSAALTQARMVKSLKQMPNQGPNASYSRNDKDEAQNELLSETSVAPFITDARSY